MESKMYTVKLTYFKDSGKYYCLGEFQTEIQWFYQIFDHVRLLNRDCKLPGLSSGFWSGPILVMSDDHPNAYPGLVLPKR